MGTAYSHTDSGYLDSHEVNELPVSFPSYLLIARVVSW